jgi:hypothetical protein
VNKKIIIVFIGLILMGLSYDYVSSLPSGATINVTTNSSSWSGDGSSSVGAFAGNITEINIDGSSTSQSWQGYYGNVTGGMTLSDSEGSIFYNWTNAGSSGEVYASRNSSIIWTNIQCFNYTAMGNYTDDSAARGNTSQYGMNLTQLEAAYNISPEDTDGVNETFNLKDHRSFITNSLLFEENECNNIKLMNSSGDYVFEEVLLYAPDNKEVVFASLINDNTFGFDNKQHDFEMMVLEDGHGTDLELTDYYFYLELGA